MAIAAVLVGARGVGTAATATTTAGTTASSGSTFAAYVSFDATYGSITTKGDNKGNTYVAQGTPQADGSGGVGQWFVCENGSGGASHTFTFTTSSNSYPVVHLIEVTGAATASIDKIAQNQNNPSPWTATSATLSQAAELVLAGAMGHSAPGTNGGYASSNFTVLSSESAADTYWTSGVGKLTVAATTAVTPSFSRTGSNGIGCVSLVTFKEAAAGGGTRPVKMAGTFGGYAGEGGGFV